jgi:hypothetical protein
MAGIAGLRDRALKGNESTSPTYYFDAKERQKTHSFVGNSFLSRQD